MGNKKATMRKRTVAKQAEGVDCFLSPQARFEIGLLYGQTVGAISFEARSFL